MHTMERYAPSSILLTQVFKSAACMAHQLLHLTDICGRYLDLEAHSSGGGPQVIHMRARPGEPSFPQPDRI